MSSEVAPGVHVIEDVLASGATLALTIVIGARVAIIDSGLATTPARVIVPALDALGIARGRVAAIINTHGHGDHVQGNAALVEATGAPVMAHRAAMVSVEGPSPSSDPRFNGIAPDDADAFPRLPSPERAPVPVERALEDGDTIDLGGRGLRVIHAPGHAPDAILLVDDAARVVVTGDALQGHGATGGLGASGPLITDLPAYRRTLAIARDLEADTVITAHAFQPLESTVLDWRGWRALTIESAAAVDEISAVLVAAVRQQNGRARLSHLARALCAHYGYDGMTTRSLLTTLAFLEDLRHQGCLAGPFGGPDEVWRSR